MGMELKMSVELNGFNDLLYRGEVENERWLHWVLYSTS